MIKELIQYRRYILNNAIGELKYKYAGSTVGVFWNVLNPFFQILVFTFVFSNIIMARFPNLDSTGAYAIYLCSGLLSWISFSECINRGTGAFIENSTFLKKLPLPEQVFVAQISLSALFSATISYAVLFIFVLVLGHGISLTWLIVPVCIILMLMFGFGLSLMLSAVNVFFRDISQIVSILVGLWMWLTPIVYTMDILPESYRWISSFNPAYPFVTSLQNAIVFHQWPQWSHLLAMVLIAGVSLLLGFLVLFALKKEVRDNL
jgi:lipopolysaccharide transport system permease protein